MMKGILVSVFSFVFYLYTQQIELPEITNPESVIIRKYYTLQYNEKFE